MVRSRVRPFLRRFLISYLTILLIPVLLNILIYSSSTALVKRYVEEANLAIISQAGYSLDQRILSLGNLVLRAGLDSEFDSLSKRSPAVSPIFHFDLSVAVKRLRPTFLVEGIITDFFVYMTNSDYIFDANTVTSAERFFRYSFHYANWDYAQWLDFLTSRYHRCTALPAATVTSSTLTYTAVPLVWSVPFYLNTTNHTFIVFLVSEQDIFDYFKPLTDEWRGDLAIYDDNDQLIISSAPQGETQAPGEIGPETITVSVPSTVFDFRYELSVPARQVYEHLNRIRLTMFVITAVAMVVGGLAAVWFSTVNARPLRSMASLLSANLSPARGTGGSRRNPFESLSTSVSEIIASNESLQTRLSDQKSIINEVFYFRLLKEGFETREEMIAMERYLDVPEVSGVHGIALLNFLPEQQIVNAQTVEEMRGLKILLLDSIRLESNYPRSWIDIGEHSVAFLFTDPGNSREQWEVKMRAEIDRISSRIRDAVPFDTFWTVGNPVSDFINLHSSYLQAEELSRLLPRDRRLGVHFYREFASNRSDYYLPMDFLNRLSNLARAGNFDVVRELFLENWEENVASRRLAPLVMQQYLLDYRGLLIRLAPESVDPAFVTELERDDLEAVQGLILEKLQEVCRTANQERQTSNDRLRREVTEYLMENFADVSLSLHSVASHFNISEGYLSHFFKKASGSNFYAFVEALRLDRAVSRLRDSRDTVKEIAYDVGYSNVQSFRRAFKRVYGISPSEYREI